MRVLHLSGFFAPAHEWGGPTRAAALLCAALERAGVEVEVATTNARGSADLPPLPTGPRDVDGVPTTFHRVLGPRRYGFSPAMAAAVLGRARGFDLLHVHGLWSFPTVLAHLAGTRWRTPVVLSPHGSLQAWALGQKRWKKRAYMSLGGARLVRHVHLMHVTSEREAAECPARFSDVPVCLIPNCVDTAGLGRVDPPRLVTGALRLLMLGRIHLVKGFDVIIPALAEARRHVPGLELTIAGPDEAGYRGTVESSIREHGVTGAVRFSGALDPTQVREALAECDALVQPSHQESFGVAAAEAMAAGRPVVVSSLAGIAPDVAAAAAGLVVPPDPAALASALVELARSTSHRLEMGARGRALALKCWSPETVALQMKQAYERALAARNCRGSSRRPTTPPTSGS